jgi:hypothetical protein
MSTSQPTLDDIWQLFARLAKVKRLLPGYADKRIMGAAAAMALPLPDGVVRYAAWVWS